MKAFISYSINDSEQFVITLLSEKLRARGFSLTSKFTKDTSNIDAFTAMEMKESSLFIGIITAFGSNNQKVISEHHFAVSKHIPALLLVEDNVQLAPDFVNYNVIFFNRRHPHQAVDKINKEIQKVGNQSVANQGDSNNAAAWLFGGFALIGLINLLSSPQR